MPNRRRNGMFAVSVWMPGVHKRALDEMAAELQKAEPERRWTRNALTAHILATAVRKWVAARKGH